MSTILCRSVEDYRPIIKQLLPKLQPNIIVFLNGEIGAGKTTFVKLIGEEMGIKDPISSPTFNIIKVYDQKICHVDGYRLNHDFVELEEYLDQGYLIFIEWSECLDLFLTPDIIINFKYHEEGRIIEIKEGE